MTNDPVKSTDQAPRTSSGLSRRAALKRAAGAGIIMSSFSSGSALASISCKKFSNWMSGGGSPRFVDQNPCTLGRSPGFWSQARRNNGNCLPAVTAADLSCEEVFDELDKPFSSVFSQGPSNSFDTVLGSPGNGQGGLNTNTGTNVERAFAAAYLNTIFIPGYYLTTDELKDLWDGFRNECEIKNYLESTYTLEGGEESISDICD